MLSPPSRRDATPVQTNAWPVFAALYLVVFAFFILLVAVSHPDFHKTEALVASVREALQPGSEAENDDALFVAGRSALAELAGDLQALLRIARVERIGRGEELRLSIRESDLYAGDAIEPALAAVPMIDRIVAALNTPPPGLRLTMTLTLPMPLTQSPAATAPEDVGAQPVGRAVGRAARRAAAFATALIDRGSSAKVIMVGVAAQDVATIVFRFQRSDAPAISGTDAI